MDRLVRDRLEHKERIVLVTVVNPVCRRKEESERWPFLR